MKTQAASFLNFASRSVFLFSFCLLMAIPNKAVAQDQRHLGYWEGQEDGETGGFEFDSFGYAIMIFEGEMMGGENFVMEGMTVSMKYEVDYITTPYSIDIFIVLLETEEVLGTMLGIFKFNTQGKMVLCLNLDEGDRPKSFLTDDTITLTKIR